MLYVKSNVSAAWRYPIKDLGNCKNNQECYLFCKIPQNTPTCWSYNKYIRNRNVLGDSTVNISYPIAELNNCATAKECYEYCSQVENRDSCKKYGDEKGLVKKIKKAINSEMLENARNELGCTDKESCKTFCTNPENAEACHSFAIKHSLITASPSPAQDVVNKAVSELGCNGYNQCVSYCEKDDNREKCLKFAKDNNLISSDTFERERILTEKTQDLLDTAKEELDCDSMATCAKKCQDPLNKDKCQDIANQFSLGSPDHKKPDGDKITISVTPKPSPLPDSLSGPKGCANEKECQEYCKKNPKECPGYQISPSVKPEDTSTQTQKIGDYLGPGGCKTEAECREYCTKHSDLCPGFPKEKTTETKPTISITKNPTPTVEFPLDCSKNAECKERYCKKYPKSCATSPSPTPTKSTTLKPTINASQTDEFPANCSQIAECRERYCKKYPKSCAISPSPTPSKSPTNTGMTEVTIPPVKSNFSGNINSTPIPVTEIN